MTFQNNNKYLFLDDIANILWKSWSFCQKEVSSWRLLGEKKYILWKRKFVIKKEDFLNYVRTNPERVGNIENIQENIEDISKTINEMEDSHRIDITKKESSSQKSSPQNHQTTKINEYKAENTYTIRDESKSDSINQKDSQLINTILEHLNNIKDDWNSDLYTEQLKTTIEDLKEANNEDKEEYKERIKGLEDKVNDLQEELRNENKKVERSFFISDRYEKTLSKQNELLLNIINLAKNLWDWWKLSLWDIKTLISSYWVNEKIIIDESTSDIKLINESNQGFYEKLKLINDEIVIERSREDELIEKEENIKSLNKSIKLKNYVIYTIFTIIVLFWGFFIINYFIK